MTMNTNRDGSHLPEGMGDRESETLSSEEQSALQGLVDGLVWRACTPDSAAKMGPREYVARTTCSEESWETLRAAIQRYGRRERYLVTGNTFTYLMLDEFRYWTVPGWAVINRAWQADVIDKYGPPVPTDGPRKLNALNLELKEGQVVNVDTGDGYDVAAAVARIPWVKFRGETVPSTMPAHWYVVLGRCVDVDWEVLAYAIAKQPGSYLAYFRGYRTPNRYLELGDGYRYWRTSLRGTQMLNRCTPDSCEQPRRVDQGAMPYADWRGPPWWPKDLPWSEEYQRQLLDAAYGRQSSPEVDRTGRSNSGGSSGNRGGL